MRRHLLAEGWPDHAVMCLEFANTWGSNVDHAAEIDAAVRRLRERTGSTLVDIVAHSMGGLATRWFIANSAEPHTVRSIIFIATPHRGTWISLLAWGESAAELRPGSDFLRALDQRPFPEHIRTFTIRTRLETHVLPAQSAAWPGSRGERLLSFPPHAFMLRSRSVAHLISDWLRPRTPESSCDAGPDFRKAEDLLDRMPAIRNSPTWPDAATDESPTFPALGSGASRVAVRIG